jgi:hypothetical protein
MSFVRQDKTNEHLYIENYTCWQFASDLKHNAFEKGLLCGLVYIRFTTFRAHTINCFNTTDRGIIFIEPQNDELVNLDIGDEGCSYYLGCPVLYYTIVW